MKTVSRFFSVFLAFSLMLSCSAFALQADTTAGEEHSMQEDSSSGLFLPLSEKTSQSLSFTLTEAQAAQVEKAGADQVTWTLHRKAPYANPADGEFIPLHGSREHPPGLRQTGRYDHRRRVQRRLHLLLRGLAVRIFGSYSHRHRRERSGLYCLYYRKDAHDLHQRHQ